ncbi:MAG: hypothetical protein IJ055_04140, partial [Oscillospiraceae bacterium]|nr:hypothetical protein [Oscillospiraceae bacterium]
MILHRTQKAAAPFGVLLLFAKKRSAAMPKAVKGRAGSPRWLIAASEISLPAAFFRGEFKKQSGGLFFEEGRFFSKKRA